MVRIKDGQKPLLMQKTVINIHFKFPRVISKHLYN